jgi:hypothetical protein
MPKGSLGRGQMELNEAQLKMAILRKGTKDR